MRYAFKFFFLLSLFMMASPLVFAASATIKKISAQTINETVHLEISVDQPVKYHYFFLSSPDRLVIDLDNTHPTTLASPNFTNTPWIHQFRIATHDANTQRMVFELTQAITTKLSLKPPDKTSNWRLIIDLQLSNAKTSHATQEISTTTKEKIEKVLDDITLSSPPKSHVITTKKANARISHCISIVIDPGHGGHDPGAVGKHGTQEKNVTLAISKNLNRLINQTPGMCAYLTRTTDEFVSLRGRLSIARKKAADIFIAIHADNFKDASARGATVFALSQHGATNEAARWIAHNENLSDFLEIGEMEEKDKDLQSVLMDISQNETINRSLILGKDVLMNLDDISKLHHLIVEQAGFVVLKAPDIPSILVETGFLSNHYEEKQLNQKAYQQKIARAIYQGVVEYFHQYSPTKPPIS